MSTRITSTRPLLLIPDVEKLRCKLQNPPPGLAELYERFQEQLRDDADFRKRNLFLHAAIGDEAAIAEARIHVLAKAIAWEAIGAEDNAVENHTWCVAPSILRTAVYADWLRAHDCWTPREWESIAQSTLSFCYEHAVAVLRSRIPSADNQSFSLALTCAVVGHAFAECKTVAKRATELRDYGLRRLSWVLGLAPTDGYLFEGSTYQSHVVAPLAMWATVFLQQLRGPETFEQRWQPGGGSLSGILRMETHLPSSGGLLPPWDHYGWSEHNNLSALALWTSVTGDVGPLRCAPQVWERQSYIAWEHDDRMWTLLYWPDQPLTSKPDENSTLSSWTLPSTGGAIEHNQHHMRVMLAWDRSADSLQSLGRVQVNPNHLMLEIDGVPITGDGIPADAKPFLPVATDEIIAPLQADQCDLLAQQFGSVEEWAKKLQSGFLGAASTVIIDRKYGYFPPQPRHGHLCHHEQSPERHLIMADSLPYFLPRYDLNRAQRTIACCESGLVWVVDDYQAESTHDFGWQLYLRRGGKVGENRYNLSTPEGVSVTLAWLPVVSVELHSVGNFPAQKWCWPDEGSERLELHQQGERAQFVVCILPTRESDLRIIKLQENVWQAQWSGGTETLELPKELERPNVPQSEIIDSWNDLDEAPFALLDEADEALLQGLETPSPTDWRHTCAAIQTLAWRGVDAAMPHIHHLLKDTSQRYLVHAVAAWCLGHVRYTPALSDLMPLRSSPETNTAARARWAVERLN